MTDEQGPELEVEEAEDILPFDANKVLIKPKDDFINFIRSQKDVEAVTLAAHNLNGSGELFNAINPDGSECFTLVIQLQDHSDDENKIINFFNDNRPQLVSYNEKGEQIIFEAKLDA